jgi:hypothetical protein
MKERDDKTRVDVLGNARRTPTFDSTTDWAKLERKGDMIVLAEPSNSTESSMKHDYRLLYWEARKLDQYVSQHADRGEIPELESVKRDFKGTILIGTGKIVGYVTDAELNEFLAERKDKLGKSNIRITPISSWSERVVSTRWGFKHSAGATYIRRKQIKKPQRPRSKHK